MSRFREPGAAGAASDETLVCLKANDADDTCTCLYANSVMLRTWSGTLCNALEVAGNQAVASSTCSSDGLSYNCINIPVEASEVAAWEAALDIMHPPPAAAATAPITATNAMGLLQLADKYDMPGITARVRQHVMLRATPGGTTLLASWLTSYNAYPWLGAAGRYGLEEVAAVCIDNIISKRWAPSTKPGEQVVLQPQHTAALVSRLMQALPAATQLPAAGPSAPDGALVPARLKWDDQFGNIRVVCGGAL